MPAHIDLHRRTLAQLVLAFCLHVGTVDATYAQSKDRASRELKPIDVANACLARGDNVCVVRALEGKAKSAMELALLIETYRALEEPEQARPAMEQYVQRFPDASRAHAYRRMLELAAPRSSTQTASTSTSARSTIPGTNAQSAPASTRTPSAPPSASAQSAQPSSHSASTRTNAPATPSSTGERSATGAGVAPPAAVARTTAAAKTPQEEANACRAADDDHCIVRALEGKAQTAEELGMLCEAYRELGDNKRARAAMQQYVDRFPNGGFSAFYREQLTRGR